jgi:hypothetical protein
MRTVRNAAAKKKLAAKLSKKAVGFTQQSSGRSKADIAAVRFYKTIAELPNSAIDKALSADDPYGFMAAILESTPVKDPADERLKEQQANAARFKRDLAHKAGGLLEVEDVMTLLDYGTRQAAYKAVRDHRLLAVMDGGRYRFPNCQFVDGAPVAGLKDVLKAAPETNGWRMLQYLLVPEQGLAGRRPLDFLKSKKDDERAIAVRFAGRLDE